MVSSSICVIATLNLCDRLKYMCGCYTEFVWYVEICVWYTDYVGYVEDHDVYQIVK